MLIVGTAAFLVLGLMYAWSVIRIQIVAAFPAYTATEMSFCFTLTMIFFCLGGFFGSRITARHSPAYSLRRAAVLLLVGFVGASFMPLLPVRGALALLYLCYSVFAGFGTGIAYNALMANIGPWFPHHIGLCTGVMLMGFGLSSLLYALIIGKMTERYSIFALIRAFGVLIFCVVLAASFFVRKPPQPAEQTAGERAGKPSLKPTQMLRHPSFWIYFLWNSIHGGAGLMIINNAANISAYFGLIASIGMVINLFNGCGRPLAGALVDRLGQFRSMLLMNAALIVSALLLLWADSGAAAFLMLLGMILTGVVYGGGSTIGTKVIRDLYGPEHFGVNHSISNFCVIGGSLVGPLLSGVLQDRSAGGFTTTFVTLLVMGIVEIALLLLLRLSIALEQKRH